MPERFTRVVPQEQEAAPEGLGQKVNGPEIEAPEPQLQAQAQQQIRPGPQSLPDVSKMPETIQIPMAQFIQMQQQLQHATQLKPIPEEATTLKLTEKCATISQGGHELQALVIHQTQQTANGFVPIEQTLVLCVKCGASLAQIRASLGL